MNGQSPCEALSSAAVATQDERQSSDAAQNHRRRLGSDRIGLEEAREVADLRIPRVPQKPVKHVEHLFPRLQVGGVVKWHRAFESVAPGERT